MPLSIYYSGALRDVGQLPKLLAEVSDICADLHWACAELNPELQLPIEGIGFRPPGAESLWLTFDANGRLINPYSFLWEEPTASDQTTVASGIQYAGPESHMRLINLMRYIAQKYFASFELKDDSEYWETQCEERCRDWFEMFGVWADKKSVQPQRNDYVFSSR